MRLRLYHHPDGTRVAYREFGAGPPLALIHSAMLSHKEWEPSVEQLSAHFRVVLPDLPLHGDSEDSPRHPYTLDWFAEVLGGFAADVLGPSPLIGGHGAGAEIVLQAVATRRVRPRRLVLMSNRLHVAPEHARARALWRVAMMAGAIPGIDRVSGYGMRTAFSPERGSRLSARGDPAARDLLRHAFADVPGNAALARSWAKCARALADRRARRSCWSCIRACTCPCCCCGPTRTGCTRSPRPRRRCDCCPMGSCACCPALAF